MTSKGPRSAYTPTRPLTTPLTRRLLPLQYVGSLDVPRPNSRLEIVAAMRRIRVSAARAWAGGGCTGWSLLGGWGGLRGRGA